MLAVLWLVGAGCEKAEKIAADNMEPSFEQLIRDGWYAFQNGDYTQALQQFEQAWQKDSTDIEINVALGWTLLLYDAGDLQRSERLLQKAVHNATFKSDARCGLVVIRFLQEQYTEIESLVDLILANKPNYFFRYNPSIDWHDLMLIKAQAYFHTDEFDKAWQAVTAISTVFTLDPNDHRTWIIQDVRYFSFEAALAKAIEILSELYRDF